MEQASQSPPQSISPPPQRSPSNVPIVACLIVLILLGFGILGVLIQLYMQAKPTPSVTNPMKGRVLIVDLVDTKDEDPAWSGAVFNKAVQNGGCIKVSFNQMKSVFPRIETYTVSNADGKYFTLGAAFNLLASRGWRYQSRLSGDFVFVHE